MSLCCGKVNPDLCFYAGYKAAHLDSKQNARLKHSRRNNLSAETAKAESFEAESRRSRSQAVSRSNSRSQSSSRPSSQAKMYSDGMKGRDQSGSDASFADLQEMRERSKMLRDQVLGVQKSVQSKDERLNRLRNSRLSPEESRKEENTLAKINERISVQEARLKKLKDAKTKIQQQVIINSAMTTELEGLRNILTNKQKEMYDIDQLVNQMRTKLQQAQIDRNTKNTIMTQCSNRIVELRNEMHSRNKMAEKVQEKFSSQREALHSKKEDISKMDLQIAELWRKLRQAKTSQQQSSQKPAAAVAAVEPFEHKPLEGSKGSVGLPTKPQEIDIKLVERNGGSGQSSPSVSADEREPYAIRPPPPVPMVDKIKSIEDKLSSRKLPTLQKGSSNASPNGSDDNLPRRFRPVQSSGYAEQRPRAGSLNSSPAQSNTGVTARLRSPRGSPLAQCSVEEMKLEKGPVHQYTIPSATSSHTPEYLPSVSKSKNFNSMPKPFSVASALPESGVKTSAAVAKTGSDTSVNVAKTGSYTSAAAAMTSSDTFVTVAKTGNGTSADLAKTSSDTFITVAKVGSETPVESDYKQDVARVRDLTVPYNRAYPSGSVSAQRVGSSENVPSQSNSSSLLHKPLSKQSSDPSTRPSTRYATRSQISHTYIPQIDQDRLNQYRLDMEKAVRDVTRADASKLVDNSKDNEKTSADIEKPSASADESAAAFHPPVSRNSAENLTRDAIAALPSLTETATFSESETSFMLGSESTQYEYVLPIGSSTSDMSSQNSSADSSNTEIVVQKVRAPLSAIMQSSFTKTPFSTAPTLHPAAPAVSTPSSIPQSKASLPVQTVNPTASSSHSRSSHTSLDTVATPPLPTAVSTSTPTAVSIPSTTATSFMQRDVSLMAADLSTKSSPSAPNPPTTDANDLLGYKDLTKLNSIVSSFYSQKENESLRVLENSEITSRFSPDPPSSEDEKQNDFVVVYNPAETDGSQSHLKSIIRSKPYDGTDGPVSSKPSSRNARLHPLVILLDAALNGSVEEINEILPEVEDASAANDEGITALHNAICAGHMEIVQTLVEYGVDVNVVDLDGWTPLHCAASCNNQPVVEYLMSKGAAILSTTFSDQETPLEKCEVDEEGYDGTSQCLLDAEKQLGVAFPVYSVYNYEAENDDELSLSINQNLQVLRQDDEIGSDWWYARTVDNKEGYVAKSFLALSPRVFGSNGSRWPTLDST